jgi:hypothetical protein
MQICDFGNLNFGGSSELMLLIGCARRTIVADLAPMD